MTESVSTADADWIDKLNELESLGLRRRLRHLDSPQATVVLHEGRALLNFSSNDYLGFASSPELSEAAIQAIEEYGVGAGSSRLICGTLSPHIHLEEQLAAFKQTEAALTFSSGYATALGTIPALVGRGDVIILDKLAHASLIDASRLSTATLRVFPHNDMNKLRSHLKWARKHVKGGRILVITESVFSMDGDRCPLREIIELKNTYGALLMLDEAHALGVIGPDGAGLAREEGLAEQVDFQMGTLSKALGATGGYLCASRAAVDWLTNKARSFIYSTAPAPATAAVASAALDLLVSPEGKKRRKALWKNIERVGSALDLKPVSAIFPIHIGGEQAALEESARLEAETFLIPAIRYPTVPKNQSRLRLTLSALHTERQINLLLECFLKKNSAFRIK